MAVPAPDLTAAAQAVQLAKAVVDSAARHLAGADVDANQVVTYDLAHAAAAVENAGAVLEYGAKGDVEARIACAFVADAVFDVVSRILGREDGWGVQPGALDGALAAVRAYRSPEFMAALAGEQGPRHLDSDLEMVQDTSRRFAEEEVRPAAEETHRHNTDIPERIISGLADIGTFGLSVPEQYGGYGTGGEG